MLFNSHIYIFLFLPVTFFLYYTLIKHHRVVLAKIALVSASLFFYSWWNISYLPILIISLVFNFFIGEVIQDIASSYKKTAILAFGIAVNLFVLGYFKYADFFIENINYIFELNETTFNILLPLAISFFTFQQIAYLVDCYKSEAKEYDFLNYSLFVCFFPQLIAGPVVHHSEMMPQFMSNKWNLRIKYRNVLLGMLIFSIGLFKKVVIADSLAVYATNGFDHSVALNMVEGWVTSLSYTFQLYFDFSGYTDMAIGSALLFNIKLPMNFDSPYKSLNIQEFWRRWHITLSRFLRDYIYIPLGGNRSGKLITARNLMITFLLGGLWHGAGWTFVMWGALHGLALIIHRLWLKVGYKLGVFISWFITFNFINVAWVFFRAKEFSDVGKVLGAMFFGELVVDYHWKERIPDNFALNVQFGPWLQNVHAENKVLLYLALCIFIVTAMRNSNQLVSTMAMSRKKAVIGALMFSYAALSMSNASEFLYFNF